MPQSYPARNPNATTSPQKTAVFIDAGAVFFAVRDLHENRQLNYPELTKLLAQRGFGHPGSPQHLWVMWSAAVPQNPGQTRFLQYAERDLSWQVRRFHPSEGHMIDPVALGEAGRPALANRLLRFDASISFAIGRVAPERRVAVISDSFAVAEPLLRGARMAGTVNLIVFFGRLLDPRWQRILRDDKEVPVQLLDLDQHEEALFGAGRTRETTGWDDDFLLK